MADEINLNAGVEAMSAKFDEVAHSPEPVEAPVEAAPEPVTEEAPKADRPRRPDGTFMTKEEAAKAAPPPAKVEAKATIAPDKATPPPAPAAPTHKPPQSWKPTLREKWGTLPPEIQEEVDRREREIAKGLQEASGPRQNWERFTQAVQPYQAIIAASGADPIAYTSSLLQTAAGLQMGTPAQRAAIVANVIRQFGVDVTQLAGELDKPSSTPMPTPGATTTTDVQSLVDQRIQAMMQQAQFSRAQQEVAAFEQSHEFAAEDGIKAHMAALIQGGIAKDLATAYDMAVSASPDHRAVIEQRKAAEAAKAAMASTQQKQKAAVSVRSSPAIPASDRKPAPGQEGLEAMRRRAQELGME